jgi:hypothetical protein
MNLPEATWSTDTELDLEILTITQDGEETSIGFTREALTALGEKLLTDHINKAHE